MPLLWAVTAGKTEATVEVVAKAVEVVIMDGESCCCRRRRLPRRRLRLRRRRCRRLLVVSGKSRDCPVAFR